MVTARSLILEQKLMSESELDGILNAYEMTEPGISGKEALRVISD